MNTIQSKRTRMTLEQVKESNKQARKRWYEKNKEENKEKYENRKEQYKQYYQENKERIKEYSKQYRQKLKEENSKKILDKLLQDRENKQKEVIKKIQECIEYGAGWM